MGNSGSKTAEGKKLRDENDRYSDVSVRVNAIAIAAAATDADVSAENEQPSDLFKLNIDCCEAVFDWLPLEDMIAIGNSCKLLQQKAGYCFSRTYSDIKIVSHSDGFEVVKNNTIVTHFAGFVGKVEIKTLNGIHYLCHVHSKLHQLTQISISGILIGQSEVDGMKEILGKIETLRMFKCSLSCHEIFAQCPNLQTLHVQNCFTNFFWSVQKYPKLENFTYIPNLYGSPSVENIVIFLELNTNIRKFATTAEFLWENRDKMKNANIKFDELIVFLSENVNTVSFCHLLNRLYGLKFYKKLKLCSVTHQRMLNQLPTVNGLWKLHTPQLKHHVTLPSLKNVQELCVHESTKITNFESLVNYLVDLKRIHIFYARFNDIVPLIRASATLEEVKVDLLGQGIHFSEDTKVIHLAELNRERKKLRNARKITFYVREGVYLATKFALHRTDFSLICIKRLESIEWDQDTASF